MNAPKKVYFFQTRLATGEYVDVVYESASRKGTFPHWMDMFHACESNGIELYDGEYQKDMTLFAYIMNTKNKVDQGYGDHRIIDVR